MKIKIKKLNSQAVLPFYAKEGDAGMDVVAVSVNYTEDYVEYGTGLSFEIPVGYAMLIFPRSSNSNKDILLCNSVGILDSGYRGELKLRYKRVLPHCCNTEGFLQIGPLKIYELGDKVGQIMIIPYPKVEWDECIELSETNRGTGGFGSTDS